MMIRLMTKDFDEIQRALAEALTEAAADIEAKRAERTASFRTICATQQGPEMAQSIQQLVDEIFRGILELLPRATELSQIGRH